MSVDIKVPSAGESVTSAGISQWHKQSGDAVSKGEVLVTLDTDKVSTDLEAEDSGILQIIVSEGEEVKIGTIIGKIEVSTGAKAEIPKASNQGSPIEKKEIESSTILSPEPVVQSSSQSQQPPSPQLSSQSLTDASRGDASRGVVRKKMSILRKKIANRLVQAQHTAAILTTFNEADMSEIMNLRKEVQEDFIQKHGVKLGFMSFFTKAVVEALKEFPMMNARIDGSDILSYQYYDVGIAIGTEKGLIVPIIRDSDKKNFADIEKEILSYAEKAKEGRVNLEDLQGGGFTISNGGIYGSLLSTPIINFPQSGILGMHTIQKRPVVINDEITIRPMMYLALSYDHRLLDGKEAVGFLCLIKDFLENPARLFLEM